MTTQTRISVDPTIRPAATIALLRDTTDGPEVFMLRRSAQQVFAARAYVYPGGRVDPVDRDANILNRYGRGAAAAAEAALGLDGALRYWSAAVRECFEEAGVLVGCDIGRPLPTDALTAARDQLNAGTLGWQDIVDQLALRFDADALRYFAHWITPPGLSRRFSTRFFAARAPTDQKADADGSETTRGEWLHPAAALDRRDNGEMELWRPTVATLQQLAAYADVDEALTDMATRTVVSRP